MFEQTKCFFASVNRLYGSLIFMCSLLLIFQDGRIDYNEFVAMMQKGNNNDFGKKGLQNGISFGFRQPLPVY